MKKLYYLIVLALILGLVLTGCLLSNVGQVPTTGQSGVAYLTKHTEEEPLEIDLIAGGGNPASAITVGVVEVWNDGDTLYVKYAITEAGWCLTETHLHVADDLDLIPHTKKGNPIPGQFDYNDEHVCVTEFTYTLAWDPCTELFIAAHAVVANTGGELTTTCVVSGDGTTQVTQRRSGNDMDFSPVNLPAELAWEPGPSYPNDGPDDSSWEADSLWDKGLSTDLRPTGADWIWESYRVLDPVYGTVLTFEKDFDIEGYPMNGTLLIACDNGYEAFVNGTSVGNDNVYGDWRTSNLKQAFVDISGWDMVGLCDVSGYLQSGMNTLKIDAANEYFNTDDSGNNAPGTESSNPGGLIFELCYETAQTETAWGEGIRFVNKGNWGMYFTYTVQCPPPELINGSFEYPVVGTNPGWDIFDSEYDEFFGWTVEWHNGSTTYGGEIRPDPAHLELHRSSVLSITPPDGDQYAELDTDWQGPVGPSGEPASVAISQMINTCDCELYQVTFYYLPRSGAPDNGLEVYWDGDSKFFVTNPTNTNWIEVIIPNLSGAPGEIETELMFIETGTPDSLGMFLDDVSVEFYVAP